MAISLKTANPGWALRGKSNEIVLCEMYCMLLSNIMF